MGRRSTRKETTSGRLPEPRVVWTRAARAKLGIEPGAADTKRVHAAELIADLVDIAHRWIEYPRGSAAGMSSMQWHELRGRIARASEETAAQARARAETLRSTADVPLRCVFAYLFPKEAAWSQADAEACLSSSGGTVPRWADLLVGSLDDPEMSRRIVEGRLRADERRDVSLRALDIVYVLGPRAFPVLEVLFEALDADRKRPFQVGNSYADTVRNIKIHDMKRRSAKRIPRILEAIELIRSIEAASFFAARLGSAEISKFARRYFRAEPELALLALPPVTGGKNRAAAVARSLIDTAIGDHPHLREAAPARFRNSRRPIVVQGPAEVQSTIEDASVGEIPLVLADPPWRREVRLSGESLRVSIVDVAIPIDPKLHSVDTWATRLPRIPASLVFSPQIAFTMAHAWLHRTAERSIAHEWLLAFPEIAAVGIIPTAVYSDWNMRLDARRALQLLMSHDAEAVRRALARYSARVQAIVASVMALDPLDDCPLETPVMPRFFRIQMLPRPLLVGRTRALPVAAAKRLVEMLVISSPDYPYAGFAQVKAACDQASLDAFVWAIHEAWLAVGAPARHRWCLRGLGELGGDEIARRLSPLILAWPAQGAVPRARAAIAALARIGTDIAVTHLSSIAERSRFRAIKADARAAVEAIASARGLSLDDLADRTVPDIEVGPGSFTEVDYGRRSFVVGFNDYLEPFVEGRDGRVLSDLPRPTKGDDTARAEAAIEAWSTRRSNLEATVDAQARRLERAMIERRRWQPETFRTLLVGHRLLIVLIRGLVLGAYDEAGAFRGLFRVSEDGALIDVDDAPVSLGGAAHVGIPHPLDLDSRTLAAWGTVLADHELLQPFPQLGRDVHTLEEPGATELLRFSGRKVATKKLLELGRRGWEHILEPNHTFDFYWKPLPGSLEVRFDIRPGINIRYARRNPEQVLGPLHLIRRDQHVALGELDPVLFSELVRELTEVLD